MKGLNKKCVKYFNVLSKLEIKKQHYMETTTEKIAKSERIIIEMILLCINIVIK